MRIGIIGNCTAAGLGITFQQMLSDAEALAFEMVLVSRAKTQDATAEVLSECDVVFTQSYSEQYGPLATQKLRDRCSNIYLLPNMTFTGFHPDCVYLTHEGSQYRSPIGVYHSGIAASAFSLGLNAEAATRLYNLDNFRKLGYLDEFNKARLFLEKEFDRCGLILNDVWAEWMARAPFMYTTNHPKGFAVAGIAKLMAIKAGLISSNVQTPELAVDTLSMDTGWPVYPELAAALNFTGNYLFKRQGVPNAGNGSGIFYSLPEFVALSFTQYAAYPPEVFSGGSVARIRSLLQ